MPKLQMFSKTKKENYGIQRHDSYNVIIPYKIAKAIPLQDGMVLYAAASEKTGTIRLHVKELKDSTPVKIRQRLTKVYRNQKYHSVRVTIPVHIARMLHLQKNDDLEVNCNGNTIIIKSRTKNKPERKI